jgi:hypothetical protein
LSCVEWTGHTTETTPIVVCLAARVHGKAWHFAMCFFAYMAKGVRRSVGWLAPMAYIRIVSLPCHTIFRFSVFSFILAFLQIKNIGSIQQLTPSSDSIAPLCSECVVLRVCSALREQATTIWLAL